MARYVSCRVTAEKKYWKWLPGSPSTSCKEPATTHCHGGRRVAGSGGGGQPRGRQASLSECSHVLAWAGSAAQLVERVTVSSVLRTTVGDPSKETILWRNLGNPAARDELRAVRLVVIDEAPTIQGR